MKKILIVVDMQKDFITGSLGTKEAEAIVSSVVQKIEDYRAHHYPIYFTKDTHAPGYLSTQEGKMLPVEHCIKYTEGWDLHDDIGRLAQVELSDKNHGVIFEKNTFGSKDLAEALALSISGIPNEAGDAGNTGDPATEALEIQLVGLCTDICVISNALLLKAFMPEVAITVDAQCCAGVTPESHVHALKTMSQCQINIINL